MAPMERVSSLFNGTVLGEVSLVTISVTAAHWFHLLISQTSLLSLLGQVCDGLRGGDLPPAEEILPTILIPTEGSPASFANTKMSAD